MIGHAERVRLRVRTRHLGLDVAHYLPTVIIAGYGGFILSLFMRNDLTLYINPAYVWPTVLAGAVLIAFSVLRLVKPRAGAHEGEACCADDTCGCESGSCSSASIRMWPSLVLSIPLFLAIVLPPRSLAAFSAMQRGPQIAGMTSIRGVNTVSHVSLSVDTASFTLQDWAGALSADPNPKDYIGKPVDISGMVLRDPGAVPTGYIMVMRYQVTCCIADARPIGLIVRDPTGSAIKDSQWIKVSGVMGAASYQGQRLVVVEPKRLEIIKAGNPYMY